MRSSKGFTLLEVLAALSIMMVASIGIVSLVKSQNESVSFIQDRLSHQSLRKEIDEILSNGGSCTATFRNLRAPASAGGAIDRNISIKNRKNEVVFNASNKSEFERLDIKSIRLEDVTPESPSTMTGQLVVQVQRQRTGGGPRELTPLSYKVHLSVNPTTRQIQSCDGDGGDSETEGEWVNLLNPSESHADACNRVGLAPFNSYALGVCASGEVRPRFGKKAAKIVYKHGTWGRRSIIGGDEIVGSHCYAEWQKRDGDGTDQTVAVLCK